MTRELWQWTAVETAAAVRDGLVSAREVVDATLARVEHVNPVVNALAVVLDEEARAAADAADARRRRGEQLGPLHGVPITTKINSDQAGTATTDGVARFSEQIPQLDAPQIENLRAAGAVVIGRSNVPAFSVRWFTDNDLHGRTLNPWNPSHTPGGSSGGAAVAVSTGMGSLAQGNDYGGSIRYPAGACGVVGLRPTPGRVPHWIGPADGDPTLGAQLMSVDGPLARTVSDAWLGLQALAAPNPRDPFYVPVPLEGHQAVPRRIGVLREIGVVQLDHAVDRTLTATAAHLANAGYEIEEVELPFFEEAWRLWWLLTWGMEFYDLRPLIERHGDDAIRAAAANHYAFIDTLHDDFSLEAYQRGYARRSSLMRRLQNFMQDYAAILMPVSASSTFENDADTKDAARAGEVFQAQWPLKPAAFLGFPALSVPGAVVDGLPIGVQILTRRFREDVLIDIGRIVEANNGVQTPVNPAGTTR